MNICVAGWYFHKPLFDTLEKCGRPWFVVAHRESELLGQNSMVIPNLGLEFGCYQWYLMNHWREGDTLFIHDDNEVTLEGLRKISEITFDQCFLFNSAEELAWNARQHGRAFFCSERFLRQLRADGGFWYDDENRGDNGETRPGAANTHNLAIIRFGKYLKQLPKDFIVGRTMVLDGLNCGYRGRISCPATT